MTAHVTINELVGTLPNAFSYTNDGTNAASAALWCSAAKVAFASNTDGMLYIDPDGKCLFVNTALVCQRQITSRRFLHTALTCMVSQK